MERMPGVCDSHHCVLEAAFSQGPVTRASPRTHKPP